MNENIMIGIFIITAIFLATQRWFWAMLFGVGALASFLSIFASVIKFQILPAVGFVVLTMVLLGITAAVIDRN